MNEQIIHRLKEFYELETFQVSYYESQLSSAEDPFYRLAFTKMAKIEGEHRDYFARELMRSGIEVPKVIGTLAGAAGKIVGESVELSGPANTCNLGVALEKKAMAAYREFILEAEKEPALQQRLMEYLLDEEFHALWLQNYAEYQKKIANIANDPYSVNEQEHPTLNINLHLH